MDCLVGQGLLIMNGNSIKSWERQKLKKKMYYVSWILWGHGFMICLMISKEADITVR